MTLALVAVAVVAALSVWVSRSPIFAMRSLRVDGNSHLTDGEVAALAGLSSRTNVVWFSPGDAVRRLLRDPWIRSAHVSRSLPTTIAIDVRERTPVAVVAAGRARFLVAADGVVLGAATDADVATLPTVPGPAGVAVRAGSRLDEPAAMGVAAGLTASLRHQVLRIALGPSGVELLMRAGVRVVYGDASAPEAKARSLAAVLAWARAHRVTPASIDVSAPSAPALRPVAGTGPGVAASAQGSGPGSVPPGSPPQPSRPAPKPSATPTR